MDPFGFHFSCVQKTPSPIVHQIKLLLLVASPQPMDLATSLTLTNAEKSKHQTYRVLMKLVRYEHGVARLPKLDFYPMALTSFGEWSASLFKFLKDCTSQYYAHASALARAGFYTDDCSLPERKSSLGCHGLSNYSRPWPPHVHGWRSRPSCRPFGPALRLTYIA